MQKHFSKLKVVYACCFQRQLSRSRLRKFCNIFTFASFVNVTYFGGNVIPVCETVFP